MLFACHLDYRNMPMQEPPPLQWYLVFKGYSSLLIFQKSDEDLNIPHHVLWAGLLEYNSSRQQMLVLAFLHGYLQCMVFNFKMCLSTSCIYFNPNGGVVSCLRLVNWNDLISPANQYINKASQ